MRKLTFILAIFGLASAYGQNTSGTSSGGGGSYSGSSSGQSGNTGSNSGSNNNSNSSGFSGGGSMGATDPAYKLSPGDQISVNVYEEPEFNTAQMVDLQGKVRLPHLGDTDLSGKSVREAERFLEETLKSRGFLKKPLVNIVVTGYSPREVMVLGQVRSPSSVQFPRDATALDIVDVISRVGGFTPQAKSGAVNIGRRQADGTEQVFVVDVESMMKVRRNSSEGRKQYPIYPGDRIWVDTRVF